MISVEKYCEGVNTIYDLNPDYKVGHDGSDGYCDCIGMCKGSIRRAGEEAKGLQGTNYAARYTLKNMRLINDLSDLRVGDVVLKSRNPGEKYYDLPDSYQKGGANYNGDLTDYYHIGSVTRINPVEITHMTDPKPLKVTKEKQLKTWQWVANLPQVKSDSPEPVPPTPVYEKATVTAPKGTTVNLRKSKSILSKLVARVPIGTVVPVLQYDKKWCKVSYTDSRHATWVGYMMTEFLDFGDTPSEDKYSVTIFDLTYEEAEDLAMEYPNARIDKQ